MSSPNSGPASKIFTPLLELFEDLPPSSPPSSSPQHASHHLPATITDSDSFKPSRTQALPCHSDSDRASSDPLSDSWPWPLETATSASSTDFLELSPFCNDGNIVSDSNAPAPLSHPIPGVSTAHSQPTNATLCNSTSHLSLDDSGLEAAMLSYELTLMISSSLEHGPSIATPIPRPYSLQSEEALAAMISPAMISPIPHRDPSKIANESTFSSLHPSPDPQFVSPSPFLHFPANSHSNLKSSASKKKRKTLLLRPISPTTLMMLTDPLLMAWTQDLCSLPKHLSKVDR